MPTTLQEAVQFYGDIENCIGLLMNLRFPDGVVCPHCGNKTVKRITYKQLIARSEV